MPSRIYRTADRIKALESFDPVSGMMVEMDSQDVAFGPAEDSENTYEDWLAILVGEVGDAGKHVLTNKFSVDGRNYPGYRYLTLTRLQCELIHAAAVAIQFARVVALERKNMLDDKLVEEQHVLESILG